MLASAGALARQLRLVLGLQRLGLPLVEGAEVDDGAELGLGDVQNSQPDPALFGYTLEHVLQRLVGMRA